jgi:predicted RNase H-like HicB family nuclease
MDATAFRSLRFPDAILGGDSYEHAVVMAREAIDLYLKDAKAHDEKLPVETSVVLASVEVG